MKDKKETHAFKAEVKQLMNLIINSRDALNAQKDTNRKKLISIEDIGNMDDGISTAILEFYSEGTAEITAPLPWPLSMLSHARPPPPTR